MLMELPEANKPQNGQSNGEREYACYIEFASQREAQKLFSALNRPDHASRFKARSDGKEGYRLVRYRRYWATAVPLKTETIEIHHSLQTEATKNEQDLRSGRLLFPYRDSEWWAVQQDDEPQKPDDSQHDDEPQKPDRIQQDNKPRKPKEARRLAEDQLRLQVAPEVSIPAPLRPRSLEGAFYSLTAKSLLTQLKAQKPSPVMVGGHRDTNSVPPPIQNASTTNGPSVIESDQARETIHEAQPRRKQDTSRDSCPRVAKDQRDTSVEHSPTDLGMRQLDIPPRNLGYTIGGIAMQRWTLADGYHLWQRWDRDQSRHQMVVNEKTTEFPQVPPKCGSRQAGLWYPGQIVQLGDGTELWQVEHGNCLRQTIWRPPPWKTTWAPNKTGEDQADGAEPLGDVQKSQEETREEPDLASEKPKAASQNVDHADGAESLGDVRNSQEETPGESKSVLEKSKEASQNLAKNLKQRNWEAAAPCLEDIPKKSKKRVVRA